MKQKMNALRLHCVCWNYGEQCPQQKDGSHVSWDPTAQYDNKASYKDWHDALVNDKLQTSFSYEVKFWDEELLDDVYIKMETQKRGPWW